MTPLDALTLSHLAAELDIKLADGKVNKIQQASHHDLLITLWVGGEAGRQKFYISINPENAYCALVDDTAFLQFPKTAPNFCMVLRKHLTGAHIQKVETLPDERVINLVMDNYNELGQHVQLILSIELMGKQSNIILFDPEVNLILGCAHGVSEQMSRQREVSVGYPYVPPPRPPKTAMRHINQVVFINTVNQAPSDAARALTEAYFGVGKATITDLLITYPEPDKAYLALQQLFQHQSRYPAIDYNFKHYSLLIAHQGDASWQPQSSVNTLIKTFYGRQQLQGHLTRAQHRFNQILKAQRQKLQKRMAELNKTNEASIEALKQSGDLLTIAASQSLIATGTSIAVPDYLTGSETPINLSIDPHLTLMENAQGYYKRYKKAQSRERIASEIREGLQHSLDFIETLQTATDLITDYADIIAIQQDFVAQGWLKAETGKASNQKEAAQPLSLVSQDGMTLLVGKNGLQNEQIVKQLSRPDDIWLHAHLIPGAHVLIKTQKQGVSPATLEQAAELAAYYSRARHSVNVPVIYTQARYVRKIPNSYPGHATYTHEEAINVTPALSFGENTDKSLLDSF